MAGRTGSGSTSEAGDGSEAAEAAKKQAEEERLALRAAAAQRATEEWSAAAQRAAEAEEAARRQVGQERLVLQAAAAQRAEEERLANEAEAGLARKTGSTSDGEEDNEVSSRFEIVEKLGEGTYGKVYKAVHRDTGRLYALKKIRILYDEEGVPSTAIREVSLVRECNHPNVIRLHEIFATPSALHLVFEFLDMDLRMYLKRHGAYKDPLGLKSAAYQCTCGIEYIHGHRILHRDLKPQNVLIDIKSSRLKLADFGLARAFSVPLRAYTHEVVTLWYRAIEILLGQCKYATPMDIWSLGCIIAEMATAQALFPGDSQIDTIFKIFQKLGTPSDEDWPGVSSLRDFKPTFPTWADTQLAEVRAQGPALGSSGIDLLQSCFRYDPVKRLSARRLQHHLFFDGVAGVD